MYWLNFNPSLPVLGSTFWLSLTLFRPNLAKFRPLFGYRYFLDLATLPANARVARLVISSPKMSKAGAMGTLLAKKINFRPFLRFGDNAGDLGKASRILKSSFITIYFRTQILVETLIFDGWAADGAATAAATGLCWRR